MNRKLWLGIVLILIIGAIWYFESQKVDVPAAGEAEEIHLLDQTEQETVVDTPPTKPTETGIDPTVSKAEEKTDDMPEPEDIKIQLDQEDIDRIKDKEEKYRNAIELVQPDGYINTDGITIKELVGKKVILVDFWTYSCINCQRTLPYLSDWYSKYSDQGLEIVGVHTPEFDFEKEYDNLQAAVTKWNIEYPVVQDNNYYTWRAYKNRYWPRKYLIDIDGFIVFDHIGEGAYGETETKIQELLKERADVLGLDEDLDLKTSEIMAETPEFLKIRTPEIYFGYEHGIERRQLGNEDGWFMDSDHIYTLPKEPGKNRFFLDGRWKADSEFMELTGDTGKIYLRFFAKKVNIVAGSKEPTELKVFVDGELYKTITVDQENLYNVVDMDDYAEHELILEVEKGLMAYTFTFG